MITVYLLNFSHPVTPDQQMQIKSLLAGEGDEHFVELVVRDFPVLAPEGDFAAQARELLLSVTREIDLRSVDILVNLPGLSAIAALVLAGLAGLVGYIPACIRLRPAGTTFPRFEVAEILYLQEFAQAFRTM